MIPDVPHELTHEHHEWHDHPSHGPAFGVDFMLFHRRFVRKMLAYFATRPDLAGFDFSPWPSIPSEVRSATLPFGDQTVRWLSVHEAAVSRLEGDIRSFDSVDAVGHFIDGEGSGHLHGNVHALIEGAYGDSMDLKRTPELVPLSNYFYRLHGYLDRFLAAWVAARGPGRLFHAIGSAATGTWGAAYGGDVAVVTGNTVHDARRAAVAAEGVALHVLAVRANGSLWHTLRRGDGGWYPFADVGGQAGRPGTVRDVAAAFDGTLLHVVAVLDNGSLWHCARRTDGSWTPLANLAPHVGYSGGVTSVACAAASGSAHVAVATAAGSVRHTVRNPDGSWTPLTDPVGATGPIAGVQRVAATVAGADVHVVAVSSDGAVRHSVRLPGGGWTRWGDVVAVTQGAAWRPYSDAACAAAGAEVHVMLASAGRAPHTIRRADGSWYPLGDATAQMQCEDIPRLAGVDVATIGGDLHVVQVGAAR